MVCFDDWKFGFQLIIYLYLFILFGEAAVIFKGGLFAMEKVVEKQQKNTGDK